MQDVLKAGSVAVRGHFMVLSPASLSIKESAVLSSSRLDLVA